MPEVLSLRSQENLSRPIIPYKQFKGLPLEDKMRLPKGTVVGSVPPGDMLASQNHLSDVKSIRVNGKYKYGDRIVVIGCIIPVPDAKSGWGLVGTDGTHSGIYAHVHGLKVDVVLEPLSSYPHLLDDPTKIEPLRRLVGRYPDLAYGPR